jgi:hypothetical protein
VASGEEAGVAWLALDTGADGLVLYDVPHGLSFGVERDTYRSRKLRSAGRTLIVKEARVKSLRVGTIAFGDVAVTLLPESMGASQEEGLLPGSLFRSLFVDPVKQFAVLNGSVSPHAPE